MPLCQTDPTKQLRFKGQFDCYNHHRYHHYSHQQQYVGENTQCFCYGGQEITARRKLREEIRHSFPTLRCKSRVELDG